MRSLLLGLLSTAAVASVLAPTTAAAAANNIQWRRYDGDGVHLDVPKGWTVDVSDEGAILLEADPHDEYGLTFGLATRRAGRKTHAVKLLQRFVNQLQYDDAKTYLDPDSLGDKDHAVVVASDSYHSRDMLIGVRVDVDRSAGEVRIAFLRGMDDDFRAVEGLSFVDRVIASTSAPKRRTSHHSRWDWETYRDDHIALLKPTDWNLSVKRGKRGVYRVAMYDGEQLAGSSLGVILMRVPSKTVDDDDHRLLALTHAARLFPDAYVIDRDGPENSIVLGSPNSDGPDLRIGVMYRGSHEYVSIAVALGDPDPFWRAGMIDMTSVIHKTVGLGNSELEGGWLAGTAAHLMQHYDASGKFLRDSSSGTGILIAFGDGGDYAFKYLTHSDYTTPIKLWSEERGTYTFDGMTLRLNPKRRTVHARAGKGDTETTVYKAKDLDSIEILVTRDPAYPDVITFRAPGLDHIGWSPAFQRTEAKSSTPSTFTLSRYEK